MTSSTPPAAIRIRIHIAPNLLPARVCPSDLLKAWVTMRYIAVTTNRAMACLVIWALPKRLGRRVALCGHGRSWALRAVVLLLAYQTQSGAAPLNFVPLPHTNVPRRLHHRHKHYAPASLWKVGFIHWYIHLCMLCWGHVPLHGHSGEALSVPHHRTHRPQVRNRWMRYCGMCIPGA